MAITVPLQVTCDETNSNICFEKLERSNGPDTHPVLNFGLKVKIRVDELLSALTDFQKSSEIAEAAKIQQSMHEPKSLPNTTSGHIVPPGNGVKCPPPAMGVSPVAVPPPPPPPPAEVPTTGSVPSGAQPAVGATREPPQPPPIQITWDSDIADLQPLHQEYVERTRWSTCAEPGRILFLLKDDGVKKLREFKPRPLEPPRRVLTRPGGPITDTREIEKMTTVTMPPPGKPPPPPPVAETSGDQPAAVPGADAASGGARAASPSAATSTTTPVPRHEGAIAKALPEGPAEPPPAPPEAMGADKDEGGGCGEREEASRAPPPPGAPPPPPTSFPGIDGGDVAPDAVSSTDTGSTQPPASAAARPKVPPGLNAPPIPPAEGAAPSAIGPAPFGRGQLRTGTDLGPGRECKQQ